MKTILPVGTINAYGEQKQSDGTWKYIKKSKEVKLTLDRPVQRLVTEVIVTNKKPGLTQRPLPEVKEKETQPLKVNSVIGLDNLKGTSWNLFTGETLPLKCQELCVRADVFRSKYGQWIEGATFYKGTDPETATDWILTMNDGGYYKVRAEYMVWFDLEKESHGSFGSGLCRWSMPSLKILLRAMVKGEKLPHDPNYTT